MIANLCLYILLNINNILTTLVGVGCKPQQALMATALTFLGGNQINSKQEQGKI